MGRDGGHTVLKSMPPIVIAEYDPQWPELFRRERERILVVLGQRALRIEHAGSTSVPGLAAKPVIDIVLEVADSAAEDSTWPIWNLLDTACAFGSRTGTSIGCSRDRIPTSIYMYSPKVALKLVVC